MAYVAFAHKPQFDNIFAIHAQHGKTGREQAAFYMGVLHRWVFITTCEWLVTQRRRAPRRCHGVSTPQTDGISAPPANAMGGGSAIENSGKPSGAAHEVGKHHISATASRPSTEPSTPPRRPAPETRAAPVSGRAHGVVMPISRPFCTTGHHQHAGDAQHHHLRQHHATDITVLMDCAFSADTSWALLSCQLSQFCRGVWPAARSPGFWATHTSFKVRVDLGGAASRASVSRGATASITKAG